LVRPKLDGALNQIVRHQAGLQGGQHHQYRPNGENHGKMTVGKNSLREIQHPGSGSTCFRGVHLNWSTIVASLHE
jgi:hypothetical protein